MGASDLDRQIEQLKRCEPLTEAEVKALCLKAMEILVEESNVQRVDAPVTVRAATHRPRSLPPYCISVWIRSPCRFGADVVLSSIMTFWQLVWSWFWEAIAMFLCCTRKMI